MKRTGRTRSYTLKMPDGSAGMSLRMAIPRPTAEQWDEVHAHLEKKHGDRLTGAEAFALLLNHYQNATQ